MSNEMLKAIKQKIQDRVARKELYSSFIDPEEIKSFNDCVSSIKRGRISLEELSLLKDIYEVLNSMLTNIASNRDNNKGSLNDQNLESILKIVKIIEEKAKAKLEEKAKAELEEKAKAELEEKAKAELEKKAKAELEEKAKAELEEKAKAELEKKAKAELEKKAKAELEKKAKAELEKKAKAELEKKAKAEFGKYIKNGTIDAVSIEKRKDQNSLYATIKLKDDNKNTDIRVSEFLNSEFCKENNIAGFLLSSGDQKEPISGYINEGVRYYNLGTAAQYGIKFNWYVGERECSITLSASDGSIKIVSNKPDDKDLEKNKDVKIKVGGDYLSLAEAVKTCKQNSQQSNDTSSKLSQPSATEHFRSVAYN